MSNQPTIHETRRLPSETLVLMSLVQKKHLQGSTPKSLKDPLAWTPQITLKLKGLTP